MMTQCVTFCIEELLWMLAWGWYQLAFGIAFTWLAHMFIRHMKIVPALALTLGAYGFAVCAYFAFVAGFFVHYLQWQINVGHMPQVYSPLFASLILGMIYSALQLLFYWIINYWRHFPIMSLFVISLICNTLAAFCASSFIRVVF